MEYRIDVTREDGWWMICIPAIDGLTQARRFTDITDEAADYVVADQDVSPSEVLITYGTIAAAGLDVARLMAEAQGKRAAVRAAESDWSAFSRESTQLLTEAEVPLRDIGAVLDVSYQRVHQLIADL